MNKNSEKNRLILADIIAKAWNDDHYKKNLINNPKLVLTKAGIEGMEDDTDVRVVENTATLKHIVLPGTDSTTDVVGGLDMYFSKILPLPPGLQLSFVQNSDKVNYVVLPMRPAIGPAKLDATHTQVLAVAGWEAINLYTTANAVAEVNAAVWTNAAAATEIAGAAVAVAVIGVVLI